MSTVWSGADPSPVNDPADYELGTVLVALRDIDLTGIRVFSPANAVVRAGRVGHVWTMGGVVAATIVMPDALPAGWSTHTLDAPLSIPAGDARLISYATGGQYADTAHALDSAVVAFDGAAAFPASSAVGGNGRFNNAPGSFPTQTFNATWYGVDAVYTAQVDEPGGTLPPGSTRTEEFAQLLDDAGVGTYHADGAAGGTIYLGALPQAPDEALAVALYGGVESDSKQGWDNPSVQVRVRGTALDYRTGERRAQAVYNALHGLSSMALAAGTWLALLVGTQSGPAYIGRDSDGRHEWTVNFRTELRNQSTNRV